MKKIKIILESNSVQFEDQGEVWYGYSQQEIILKSPRNWGKWLKRYNRYQGESYQIRDISEFTPQKITEMEF